MGVLRQDVDNTIREDKWLRGDLWNRFNYLAERQDKVDADINTTHQHIVSLGQHQHACDANFLGLRTTTMGVTTQRTIHGLSSMHVSASLPIPFARGLMG